MTLVAGCPRCAGAVTEQDEAGSSGWVCADHGPTAPLWRPESPDYDSFVEHLRRADPLPTWLPWPLAPGWQITDFGCVATPGREPRAAFAGCVGTSDLDGVVEVTVVTEEPGVGLGARVAGVDHTDPGGEVGEGPPHAKVRIEGHPVSLWSVSTSNADAAFDRSVFAGEAHGRWLWLVLRPASAALLLREVWALEDLSGLGPELVALPFGTVPRAW